MAKTKLVEKPKVQRIGFGKNAKGMSKIKMTIRSNISDSNKAQMSRALLAAHKRLSRCKELVIKSAQISYTVKDAESSSMRKVWLISYEKFPIKDYAAILQKLLEDQSFLARPNSFRSALDHESRPRVLPVGIMAGVVFDYDNHVFFTYSEAMAEGFLEAFRSVKIRLRQQIVFREE